MAHRRITISTDDHQRLQALINSRFVQMMLKPKGIAALQTELDRALIVPADQVPDDVVTMNSTIELRDRDTSCSEEYTLVFPDFADIANNRLSILSPLGTAILGYRVGDCLSWHIADRCRRLTIESVRKEARSHAVRRKGLSGVDARRLHACADGAASRLNRRAR